MDLLTFALLVLAAISVVSWWWRAEHYRTRLSEPHRTPPTLPLSLSDANPKRFSIVPCRILGVYGTVHTTDGKDYDTGLPDEIVIDCELTTFLMPVKAKGWEGEIIAFTLHLGAVAVRVNVKPPVVIRKDADTVHVVMPVSMADMEPSGGEPPEWSRIDR